MRRALRRLLKLVGWLGLGVLVLVTAVVLELVLLTRTEPGRDQARRLALHFADPQLPGRLTLGELVRLDPWGVELRDVVLYDPQGSEVARIARLRLGLDPGALTGGRLHATHALLDGVAVDLRHLDDPKRGLVAAVVAADGAPDEPEASPGEPLQIAIDRIELRNGRALAHSEQTGAVTLQELAIDGKFRMQHTIHAELTRLAARVELEAGHRVLAVGPTSGVYRDDGKASRVALQASSGALRLALQAQGVLPPHPAAERAPLSARLNLAGVDRTWLALLGLDDPDLGVPLSLGLELSGTQGALRGTLVAGSPGGALQAELELDALDRLRVAMHSDGLALHQVHALAPEARLAFALRAETRLAELPDAAPLELQVQQASLDGEALPTLQAEAELRSRIVHVARLQLQGHGLQLRLAGRYGLDTQHVALDGHARGRDVRYADFAVKQLDAELGAHGKLPLPALHVALEARALRAGETRIEALGLALDGGPTDYTLGIELQADKARLALEGKARRSDSEIELSAHGQGTLDEHPFALELRELRVAESGRISLPWLKVSALGQHVQLEAQRSARGELDVALQARELDLAELSALLDLEPAPSGRADVTLSARGTVERPRLEVHVEGRQLSLEKDEAAEPKAGLARVDTEVRLDLVADAHYAPGEATLTLRAADAVGPWLSLSAGLQPHARELTPLLAELPRLLHTAGWQLNASLAQRALAELAGLVELAGQAPLPRELQPASFGVDLTARHLPQAEPELELVTRAQLPAYGEASDRCHPPDTTLVLSARLLQGKLTLDLQGEAAARSVLDLQAEAGLALLDVLASGGKPRVRNVGYRLRVRDVAASQVPLVCTQLHGTLALDSQGQDLFGSLPRLEATLRGQRLGLSDKERLDLKLTAQLDGKGLRADGELQHAARVSRLELRAPLTLGPLSITLDRNGPMQAELHLDRLPLEPLIGSGLPVSRVRGTLSGVVHGKGTLDAPVLDGLLELDGARLTVNSLAQPLRGVKGRFAFTERVVHIDQLCGRDQSGKVCVNGRLELPRNGVAEAKLDIHVDDFPLRQQGQIVADANLDAKVTARMLPEETRVRLELRDVDMWLRGGKLRRGQSLELHADIVDPRLAETRDEEPEPESPDEGGPVHITLDASRQFWVKRDDFAVKLSTKLDLRVEPEALVVVGVVLIDRGYLQLLGETFDIDRKSTLEFVGGDKPDPVLDIGARVKSAKSGKEVAVRISGRASEPEVEFLLDGVATTAGEAVMAIMGGEAAGDEEQNVTEQAQSFAAGVMASMLAVAARRELGAAAPILMIDPGEDVESTRVRAGFELDSLVPSFMERVVRGVYVEGIVAGDSGKSGVQTGVLVEFYFPHSLVAAGQYGPGETWAVDFGWEP
jgi:autotransporter translocation and assembly factor TamB